MADPYRYFRIEAAEILEQLQKGLLELEKGAPSAEVVTRLLRHAHTLKGAARVVKQKVIADVSHALEDLLVPIRDSSATPDSKLIADALARVDVMREQLLTLTAAPVAGGRESKPESPTIPVEEAFWAANADQQELDVLMDGISELNSQLGVIRRSRSLLERARSLAEALSDQLAMHQEPRRGDLGTARLASIADELRATLAGGERDLLTSTDQAARELNQVRDAAERLRLAAANVIWSSLERTARDAAMSLGKQVSFSTYGGDIRLETEVVGRVQRALVQAVRNAIAHGVETPVERAAAGKPEAGQIHVGVERRDGTIVFSCRDDGRGVDLDAVRRSAERQGTPGRDVAAMTDDAVIQLLLRGGISTATTVTGVSGRGIGLDLVRETAEKLGGTVALESTPGRGATLKLSVPVSLSAVVCLLVDAAAQVIALPLSAVRGSARLAMSDIAHTAAGDQVLFEDKVVAYVHLRDALGTAESEGRASHGKSVVFLEAEGGLVALGVDKLLGIESVVVRALPELSLMAPVISGASLDSNGNPRMVVSPVRLVHAARTKVAAPQPPKRRPTPILVIDDSLTTRMLEQSILESAGYEVELATSGEDGMKKAREREFSLFLVDVEMPGMDGFTFIEQTRADPKLKDIPAILVTSRASAADLERGKQVGARAHIEKKEFNQTEFLARIRALVS